MYTSDTVNSTEPVRLCVCVSEQWRRQDFSLGGGRIEAPRGFGAGRGCPLPPGEGSGAQPPHEKIFDYLILK